MIRPLEWIRPLLLGLALANPAAASPLPRTVIVGGVERHYLVVVPAAYDGKNPVPLVFVFHGAGNTGALMIHKEGINILAERHTFIAVFPDGLGKEWNGGRLTPTIFQAARSDDVAFVAAMIDRTSADYKIDPKRIFATGSSNGAIFCYTLAARLSDRIAAIAPVNGSLGTTVVARYHPTPISVISFNGTDDPFVPYAGYGSGEHSGLSVPDTLGYWVKVDGCDPKPAVTAYPPSPLDDGLLIVKADFGNGPGGYGVTAYIIRGGGHTWPGHHTDPTWAKQAGKTAMSIDADELMWDFFVKHPKS